MRAFPIFPSEANDRGQFFVAWFEQLQMRLGGSLLGCREGSGQVGHCKMDGKPLHDRILANLVAGSKSVMTGPLPTPGSAAGDRRRGDPDGIVKGAVGGTLERIGGLSGRSFRGGSGVLLPVPCLSARGRIARPVRAPGIPGAGWTWGPPRELDKWTTPRWIFGLGGAFSPCRVR